MGALNSGEEEPRLHLAGIVTDSRQFDIGEVYHLWMIESGDQGGKLNYSHHLDWGPFLALA
jgi:hypothetical protein